MVHDWLVYIINLSRRVKNKEDMEEKIDEVNSDDDRDNYSLEGGGAGVVKQTRTWE